MGSLHRTLGKLACDISQLSSSDVEIVVNIQFRKSTTNPTSVNNYPTSESEHIGSAHSVLSLEGLPNQNPESLSAEDGSDLKTSELFPKARVIYN